VEKRRQQTPERKPHSFPLYRDTVPGNFHRTMKAHVPAGSFLFLLVSALSCSPAAPPAGRGDAHYLIDNPVSSLPACGVSSVAGIADGSQVPDLPVGTSPPAAESGYGVQVRDGQEIPGSNGNYIVRCRVVGSGSRIEVYMEGPNTSPQAGVATGATNIEVTGSIGADGTGTGDVVYRTTRSGTGSNPLTAPCTLSATPNFDGSAGFEVGGGAARFSFFCPETIRAQDDLGRCEAKGTIWVQDCVDD
jgi:hypothetical protein